MSATREQFAQEVITVVKKRFPLAKVARAEQPFSLRINGHVASLENLYRLIQLHPDDVVHQMERWAVELLRASEGTPDNNSSFSEIRDRVMPVLMGHNETTSRGGDLVTTPLIENLDVTYVIDGDRTVAYIPKPALENWSVSLEELHEIALENLIQQSQTLHAHAAQDEEGSVNLVLFQTLDGFDASRLLLPTLHDRLRGHLGSPFVAAVPNRDILLCFRDDEQTIAGLRSQIEADFRTMPHQVTEKLLLITPDGIAARVGKL